SVCTSRRAVHALCLHDALPIFPTGAGRVMEKELISLDRGIKGGERPTIFVLGGAKVDDSLRVAENVLSNGGADRVLLTGIVANVDRKSTRLNSSHVKNSYAVFC